MKKRIFYGFVIAACLLLVLPVTAEAVGDGSFSYSYAGSGNLQSAVENELESNYGQSAGSYDYSVITSLTLSGNLQTADYTFFKSSLTAVSALDLSGVTSAFPSDAFRNCTSITQVKLPVNLALSDSMFRGCMDLTTLVAGSGALTANVIDLSSYTVASYGNSAFRECTGITQVKLPADKVLSQNMFGDCTGLTTLGIGSGALTENVIDLSGYTAASYGSQVFRNTGITQVKLPADKVLSQDMFYQCTGLTTLVAGSGTLTANVIDLSGYTADSYGAQAFSGSGIMQVKLPADKALSNSMFFQCADLTTLGIGAGELTPNVIDLSGYTATSYGLQAFTFCTGITQVKLPADKALSDSMFNQCVGLTTLGIGAGDLTENVIDLSGYTADSYGIYAFAATGITQVKLPADISLSHYIFYNCPALHSIFFYGGTAPAIESDAFTGTSNAAAYVPDSTTGGYEDTDFSQHFTNVHTMQIPSFNTHPQPQTKTVGDNVTFSVAANGLPAPTLQWQVSANGTDWNDLGSETGTTLSFTAALSQNDYQYRCVASSLLGTNESNATTLTVLAVADTPTVSFSFDGANAGKLMGTTTQMKYSLDGGNNWTDCAAVSTDLSGVIASITAENDIKIKDMGDGSTTAESEVQTINITLAATPGLTATQPCTIGGSGSIPMTTMHEYSNDGGITWTNATGTATLPAGAYLVRVKAAGTVLASDTQSITLTAYTGVAETTPAAVADYSAEELTGLTANGGYAVNGTDVTADADGKIEIVNTWFGTTISLVKKGDGITTNDSEAQSILLTARPAAPVCDVTQPNAGSDTGSITGIGAAMEYSTDGGASWMDGTDNDVTGLAPGTVLIRIKATLSAPAGTSQSITINAYSAPPPSGGGGSATPTPTYNADVNAGTSGDTTLTVTVDGSKGIASVETSSGLLGAEGTVVTMPSVPGVNAYAVGIPVPDLSTTNRQGSLTVNTDNVSVTLPSDMLTGVTNVTGSKAKITIGQADKAALPEDVKSVVGDKPVISLTLSIDGVQTDWSNPNTPVTVSIPYTPTAEELANPESIIVWYIDGSGNVVTIPNGSFDAAAGTVVFSTTHFSDYAVAYYPVSFTDVADTAWYAPAVSFIAAREITSGTCNGSTYSPEAKLTRGEFIVLMMRAYGIEPDENPTDNFADADDTYYTGYLAAAKRLGITAGVGENKYAPAAQITRQEMFTLLYNALKVIGQLPMGDSGKTVLDFSDAAQISAWAQEAMTLLVETGTVGGNNGMLTPTGTTTRAEMAQVLYNLLGK